MAGSHCGGCRSQARESTRPVRLAASGSPRPRARRAVSHRLVDGARPVRVVAVPRLKEAFGVRPAAAAVDGRVRRHAIHRHVEPRVQVLAQPDVVARECRLRRPRRLSSVPCCCGGDSALRPHQLVQRRLTVDRGDQSAGQRGDVHTGELCKVQVRVRSGRAGQPVNTPTRSDRRRQGSRRTHSRRSVAVDPRWP